MPTWQITVLVALAGCVIGCLLGILIAIEKVVRGISSIGMALTKLNANLERIEAITTEDDTSLEAVEAALSNFEKLKRIDLAKS